MSDPDTLPPARPLPPEVRAAARLRIDARTHSGRGVVTALAVAVAVLVVPTLGATVFASLHPQQQSEVFDPTGPRPQPPAARFLSPEQLYSAQDGAPKAAATRCRNAGMAGKPVVTASARGDMIIAFRSGDGVRFCELTPASVAISPPTVAPPPGSGTITFLSPYGTVAGVVDKAVGDVSVRDSSLPFPATDHGEPAVVRNGVFLLPNTVSANPADLGLWLGSAAAPVSVPATDLPSSVDAKTDHPQPVADRSSAAGRELNRCLANHPGPPLVDADAWKPAAARTLNAAESVQLARYGNLLAVCVFRGANRTAGAAELTVDDGSLINGVRDTEADFLFTHTVFYGFTSNPGGGSSSDTVAVTGLATDPRIASVSISRPTRAAVVAPVVDGTFILPGIGLNEEPPGTPDERSRLTAYDSAGHELGHTTMTT